MPPLRPVPVYFSRASFSAQSRAKDRQRSLCPSSQTSSFGEQTRRGSPGRRSSRMR